MTSVPKDARVFVAGHAGLVGSAVLRKLKAEGYTTLLVARRDQLDLRDQAAVNYWFRANRPEYVFLVAGTVGGIMANSTRPAEFIYDNMMIHAHRGARAHLYDVTKLLYLGSSCIYPRQCPQPINEDAPAHGPARADQRGLRPREDRRHQAVPVLPRQYGCNFISAMPTNLYGPNDNFDLNSSHVLPALIRKFHDAKVERGARGRDLGNGQPHARVPPRRRPRRCVPVPHGALRREGPHQRRHRRGPHHPGIGRDGPRRRVPGGRAGVRHDQARRHARASCSTSPSSARSAGRPRSAWKTASAPLTSGSSTH